MIELIFYYFATFLLVLGFAALFLGSKLRGLKPFSPVVSTVGFFLCALTLMVTAPERVWVGLYVLLFALLDAYFTHRKEP